MKACVTVMHWTPADFWQATPHEVVAVFESDEDHDGESFSKLYDSIQ